MLITSTDWKQRFLYATIDGRKYNDPKTQVQMIKDYQQLGTDFEDGDFGKFGDGINNR